MKTEPTPKLGSHDLVRMLREMYLPPNRIPGGLFLTEVTSPDERRRIDALWVPTTVSGGRGRHLIGHEIKVDRRDLMAELEDPAKADPWIRYCREWWLVVPDPHLVEGCSIPEPWGVMFRPTGRAKRKMTVYKPAPRLEPERNMAPAFQRLTMYLGYRNRDLSHALATLRAQQKTERERAEREAEANALVAQGTSSWEAQRIAKIVKAVMDGNRLSWLGLDDDDIVRLMSEAAQLESVKKTALAQLDHAVRTARTLADPLSQVAKRLEKLRGELT